MKRKLKNCLIVYALICFLYASICFVAYFEKQGFMIQWPIIKINLIKEYPDFEGANLIK